MSEIKRNSNDRNKKDEIIVRRGKIWKFEYLLVGNVMGFYPNTLGIPRIYIGPTWHFAIPILFVVFFLTFFLLSMLYYIETISIWFKSIAFLLIIFDLLNYFSTLLGDPGLP
jgi:hypothetical protein